MKRLKYLLIAGVSLLFASCENFLDRQPESSLSGGLRPQFTIQRFKFSVGIFQLE